MTPSTAFATEPSAWNPPQSPQSSAVTVSPITVEADWTKEAVSRVEKLRALKPNWDGYESPAVSSAAVESAYQLIRSIAHRELSIVPRIAPVTGGGIAFELVRLPRILELEVLPGGTVEYLCVEKRNGSSTIADEGQLSIPRIYEAAYFVGWLLTEQSSQ